jgi:transposase
MTHKLIGIDLAKNVFQVCAINQAGKDVFNRSVSRAKLAATMAVFKPTTVAMEACASGHYWGRKFEQLGHRVVLVPPKQIQPSGISRARRRARNLPAGIAGRFGLRSIQCSTAMASTGSSKAMNR